MNRSDGEEILSGEALEDIQEQLFGKRQQRDGRRTLSDTLPDRERETFGTSTVEHANFHFKEGLEKSVCSDIASQ